MLAVIYYEQNLLFVHPDHLCFDRTTYDNINGPAGPIMSNMNGPAGPLMYPDQIFCGRYTVCDYGWDSQVVCRQLGLGQLSTWL